MVAQFSRLVGFARSTLISLAWPFNRLFRQFLLLFSCRYACQYSKERASCHVILFHDFLYRSFNVFQFSHPIHSMPTVLAVWVYEAQIWVIMSWIRTVPSTWTPVCWAALLMPYRIKLLQQFCEPASWQTPRLKQWWTNCLHLCASWRSWSKYIWPAYPRCAQKWYLDDHFVNFYQSSFPHSYDWCPDSFHLLIIAYR